MASDYDRLLWREHMRRWRAANPERARELCREYYMRNRERIREQRRQRREALRAASRDPQEPRAVDLR